MGKVDEKKRIKQEALLFSAFELFTENGIHNTSVSDIVKRAKMAKGTFYLYFKDKYDIRDRLIAKQASDLFTYAHGQICDNEYDTLEDHLIGLTDVIVDKLNENKSLLRFISKNLSWGVFSNIRIEDMENKHCMDLFDEMIVESGREFRQKDLMIFMIVELVNSSCYNVILQEQPVTLDELKPDLFLMIRSIIKQFEITKEH